MGIIFFKCSLCNIGKTLCDFFYDGVQRKGWRYIRVTILKLLQYLSKLCAEYLRLQNGTGYFFYLRLIHIKLYYQAEIDIKYNQLIVRMGSCCEKPNVSSQRKTYQLAASNQESDQKSKKPISDNKYYGELKKEHQKMIKSKQEKIAQREEIIQKLEAKKNQMPSSKGKDINFEISKIQREIDAHKKVVSKTKSQISQIQRR